MGFSGQFYSVDGSVLKRKKIGWVHVIIDAQLHSVRKPKQIKPHDSSCLIDFPFIVADFVNVLKEERQIVDLKKISTMNLAVENYLKFSKKSAGSLLMLKRKSSLT